VSVFSSGGRNSASEMEEDNRIVRNHRNALLKQLTLSVRGRPDFIANFATGHRLCGAERRTGPCKISRT
jgi:hypothetical protein